MTLTSSTHLDDLTGMTACLIVDGASIPRFAHAALELAVERGLKVTCVAVCDNTEVPRKPIKHGAYYLYKLLFLRGEWTRRVPWASLGTTDVAMHHFDSEWEGIWQRIPPETLGFIGQHDVDVVLRFGMTLVRDPDDVPAAHGVVSFHHGDPAQYRGRPAGFYEVFDEADHLGIMVQRISNELDAGNVLAYGAVRVVPHSYRESLENAYSASSYLLVKALLNLRRNQCVDRSTDGQNYRLPGNRLVLRFGLRLLRRKLRRMLYGLSIDKRWCLITTERVDLTDVQGETTLRMREEFPPPAGYSAIADPVVIDDRTLLCEGIEARTGRGRLLAATREGFWSVDTGAIGTGHLSYPHIVHVGDSRYVLPEMAQIGPQSIAKLSSDRRELVNAVSLAGLTDLRLTDPTLLQHDGRWWLFAGQPGSAAELLFLWSAEDLKGPYVEHPDSPIVIDPSCARMAGPIQLHEGRLFRVGQDNRRGYGDGVALSEILQLDQEHYREQYRGTLRMPDGHGPHSLDMRGQCGVADRYDEVRVASAGLRRLRARLP